MRVTVLHNEKCEADFPLLLSEYIDADYSNRFLTMADGSRPGFVVAHGCLYSRKASGITVYLLAKDSCPVSTEPEDFGTIDGAELVIISHTLEEGRQLYEDYLRGDLKKAYRKILLPMLYDWWNPGNGSGDPPQPSARAREAAERAISTVVSE